MMCLPSILKLSVPCRATAGKPVKNRRYWIPLFLIWPFIFVLAIALLPLWIIVAGILICQGRARYMRLFVIAPQILCAFRGLYVEVKGEKEKILIELK